MDIANEAWADLRFFYSAAAPYILTTYTTLKPYIHALYLELSPRLEPFKVLLFQLYTHIQPHVYPALSLMLDTFASIATESPAIVTAVVLVLTLVVAMQILNLARRVVLFWTRVAMRIVFWTGILLLLSFVWKRGPARTADDVVGYAVGVKKVWDQEYERWQTYQDLRLERNQAGTDWR